MNRFWQTLKSYWSVISDLDGGFHDKVIAFLLLSFARSYSFHWNNPGPTCWHLPQLCHCGSTCFALQNSSLCLKSVFSTVAWTVITFSGLVLRLHSFSLTFFFVSIWQHVIWSGVTLYLSLTLNPDACLRKSTYSHKITVCACLGWSIILACAFLVLSWQTWMMFPSTKELSKF